MKKRKVIREYKQLTEDMNVLHSQDGNDNVFVIWKWDVLLRAAERVVEKNFNEYSDINKETVSINDAFDLIADSINPKMIVGMISTEKIGDNKAWNAHEVRLAAAEQGYGPMLYDLALSHCKVLTSDRITVSKYAEKVWHYYYTSRRDVEALPFDDIEDPKTPPTLDDAIMQDDERDWLNYAYKLKGAPIYDVNKLEKESSEALHTLILEMYDYVSEIITGLEDFSSFSLILESENEIVDKLKEKLMSTSVLFFNANYGRAR